MLILTHLQPMIGAQCAILGVKLSYDEKQQIFRDLLGKNFSEDDIRAAIKATKSAQQQLNLEQAS